MLDPDTAPGRCEHPGCTNYGDTNGLCQAHALKAQVLAALREQVSESHHHRGTPGYSNHDLVENARMFDTVADWLDDNWDEVTA